MNNMYLEQIVPILQLAIGPVIVISGVGLLLLSMINRLGRVIDRTRILAERRENDPSSLTHHIKEQLFIMMRRARLLRSAIAFISVSLLLDALLIITLFIFAIIKYEGTTIIATLFIGCMISLIVGLIYFIADINVSLSALKLETNTEYKNN
jgi:hypothetical protein